MIDNSLAPLVIFAYNRPEHLLSVLNQLKKCILAEKTDVFCFVDGAKSHQDEAKVKAVIEIINNTSGFKSITLKERTENIGLASNIIDGITWTIEQYGKVIVLEDDILVSPTFLSYMNKALTTYAKNNRVWHVSASTFPVSKNFQQDTFFWKVAMGWGWATWHDRWLNFDKNPERLLSTWTQVDIEEFNLYGSYEFWDQVEQNSLGKINTWAVFWYATIFQNKGLCLSPVKPLAYNIGFDGSGTHTVGINQFEGEATEFFDNIALNLPEGVIEDLAIVGEIIRDNRLLSKKNSQQKDLNIRALKALLMKLSNQNYFRYLYSERNIGLFGISEISQSIHEILLKVDTRNVTFIMSDEYFSSYKGTEQPIPLSLVSATNIELIIVCIEGEHEQSIMTKMRLMLPDCQLISWRLL